MEYRIITIERGGEWRAYGERVDTGDRFGLECAGATEAEARQHLTAWLDWQRAHTRALEVLQLAERAYHRAVADAAFGAASGEGNGARRAALGAVDSARVELDAVRARRPETA